MTSDIVSVFAPAKINLYFDILSKRGDGYHEVLTLFQALDLHDILTFQFSTRDNTKDVNLESPEVVITLAPGQHYIDRALFPLGNNNSILQAISIFLSALPEKPNVQIKVRVEKNIPIGAGLAGGSADAAAALIALNHYFNQPFTFETLLNFASQIGSDVSFCLSGGTAIGRGRGERLEVLLERPECHFVLVKPRSLSISTPWAYKIYDQFIVSQNANELVEPHSISQLLLDLKFDSRIEKHAELFWNAFEPAIFREHPILKEIKNCLLNLGCISAQLTGSGPTIYGLVESKEEGQRILKEIRNASRESNSGNQTGVVENLEAWLSKSIDRGAYILTKQVKHGKQIC